MPASFPDALQPLPEDLTMPSPSLHSNETPAPSVQPRSHAPHETLVSSANEADELRRRISGPGERQEEELELEEIDLDDSLPLPQALPPDRAPSETIAPAPRPVVAPTTEVEVPIELSVPPGATRIQLRLRLVLNLKQR